MKIMKKIISVFAALTLAVTVPAQVFAVSGTSAQSGKDQLTISDTEGFLKFAEDCRLDSYSSNLYVTLTADIELSGEYTPVPVFGGVFDGARTYGIWRNDDCGRLQCGTVQIRSARRPGQGPHGRG